MKYEVVLNGKKYEVEVEEGKAIVLNEAPFTAAAPAPAAAPAVTGEGEKVDSPMPGTILKVNVAAGQTVKEGDLLVILEAMKMENEIVAPADGTVSSIAVSNGQTVESGTPLLYLA